MEVRRESSFELILSGERGHNAGWRATGRLPPHGHAHVPTRTGRISYANALDISMLVANMKYESQVLQSIILTR